MPSFLKRKPKEEMVPLVNEDRSISIQESPRPGFFSRVLARFKNRRSEEESMVEEVQYMKEVEESQADLFYEDLDSPPAKKQGFFSRFFSRRVEEDVVMLDPSAKEDMKVLGKSLFNILDRLPSTEKEKLKISAEWEQVKETLRKYEVIK